MLKRIPYVILAVLLAGCGGNSADDAAIRKTFQAYRKALLGGDGPAAWAEVDAGTHAHYDKIAAAMSSASGGLKSLDILSRFMVLRMRNTYGTGELAKMDGKAVFVLGIEKGWTSKDSVQKMDRLTRVESDGKSAKGYTKAAAGASLFFVKESGGWKIAMSKLFGPLNQALRASARRQGISEDQLIQSMLAQARQLQSGRR